MVLSLQEIINQGQSSTTVGAVSYSAPELSSIDKIRIRYGRGDRPDKQRFLRLDDDEKTKDDVFAPRISRVAAIKGFEGEERTDNVITNLGLDAKEMGRAYMTLFDAMMENPAQTAKAVATNFGPAIVESYTRWAEAWKQGVFLDAVSDHPLQAAQDLAMPFLALTGIGAVGSATGVISKGSKTARSIARAAKYIDRVNTVLDPIGAGAFFAGGKIVKKVANPLISKIKPSIIKSTSQALNISVDPIVEKVPFKQKAAALASSTKQGLLDRFYPIRELGQEFEAIKRELTPNRAKEFVDSPIEQKVRLYSGFEEKVLQSLRNGMADPNTFSKKLTKASGQKAGRGLAAVFNDLEPELWPRLRDYAAAKRAVDLEARGIEAGIDVVSEVGESGIKKIIKEVEIGAESAKVMNDQGGVPKSGITPDMIAVINDGKILNTYKEWQGFGDDLLEYYQQGGMISKEAADRFRAANPNYVPFFREMGEEVGSRPSAFEIKKIKGSKRPIKDPMESHLILAGQMMRGVEVNNIVRELLPMADKPGTGVRIRKIEKGLKNVVDDADIDKVLNYGESLEPKPLPEGTIPFYKNGEKIMIELDDPMVLQAFSSLRAGGDNKIAEFFGSNSLLAIPRGLAKLKRAGITLSPGFTLGLNMVRDTMSASMNSQFGFKPIYSNIRGAMHYLKKGELYDLWAASGGMQAELSALDRPALKQRLREYIEPSNRDYLSKMKHNILHPIEFLQALQRFSEGTTRLGEFEGGIKKGLKQKKGEALRVAMERATAEGIDVDAAIRKAAVSSRDVSTDFGIRPGNTFIRAWNTMTPFQNAQLQSLDLMRRKLMSGTPKDRAKFVARAGLYITIPSMITQIPLMNDKEYQEDVPQFEKDLFWHIRMPENFPVLPGKLARVPKPFEMGLIFGSLPERTIQSLSHQDPTIMLNLTDRIIQDFQPFQFPAAMQLPLEIYTDRDFFFDAPLTPGYQKRFRKSEQALSSTSQLSRVLSKWTEYIAEDIPRKKGEISEALLSPIQIEKIITGTTGSIGIGITQAIDPILVGDYIVKPDIKGGVETRVPVLNRFISNPTKRSQIRSDFYKTLESHERILNSLDDPRLPESDRDVILKDKITIQNAKRLRKFAKKINALVKRQRQIEFSRSIRSGERKRKLIDDLDRRINVIARTAMGK